MLTFLFRLSEIAGAWAIVSVPAALLTGAWIAGPKNAPTRSARGRSPSVANARLGSRLPTRSGRESGPASNYLHNK